MNEVPRSAILVLLHIIYRIVLDGFLPVDRDGADHEVVARAGVADEPERVGAFDELRAGDRVHPVLPTFPRWDVEPRERVAADQDLVVVRRDVEDLEFEVRIDDRFGGNGELELARPVIADELRSRHVETVRAVAEVFLDGEERVVRTGGPVHRVAARSPWT